MGGGKVGKRETVRWCAGSNSSFLESRLHSTFRDSPRGAVAALAMFAPIARLWAWIFAFWRRSTINYDNISEISVAVGVQDQQEHPRRNARQLRQCIIVRLVSYFEAPSSKNLTESNEEGVPSVTCYDFWEPPSPSLIGPLWPKGQVAEFGFQFQSRNTCGFADIEKLWWEIAIG